MGFQSKTVAIGNTDTDIFQMGVGLSGAVVLGIGNNTGGAVAYTLKFLKQSTGATIALATAVSVAANTFVKFPMPISMEAGDKIIASASAASSLVAQATITNSAATTSNLAINPRGAYSSIATFAKNDLVSGADGSSYLSMTDANIGNDPTTSPSQWMVLAQRGATGDLSGASASADGEIVLFSGTTGKQTKRSNGIVGILKAVAGVISAATAGIDFVKPDTASAFTKQQSFTLATLTDGATINWDVSGAQKAIVTLGGNRTMAAVTNAVEGASYFLWVIQDGTGSRTLSWTTTGANSFDFGDLGVPVLTTSANKADVLCFEAVKINSTLKLRYTGCRTGYS